MPRIKRAPRLQGGGNTMRETNMPRMTGVLLDVDGTLVDSNEAHARAWVQAALVENGITVPYEKVRPLIGKGGDKLLPEAAGIDADSPTGKIISKRRGEVFQKEFLPAAQTLSPSESGSWCA